MTEFNDSVTLSYSEMFEAECENAMKFGMTYSEYWDGNPEMLWFYAKLYYDKTEEELHDKDMLAWMIGYYVEKAHGVVLANSFNKNSKETYFSEPQLTKDIELTPEEKEAKKVEQAYQTFVLNARQIGVVIEEAAS